MAYLKAELSKGNIKKLNLEKMITQTADAKLDLVLALVQSQAEKIASLEHQLKVRHSWNLSKWVTTGELAELTKNKVGTVTNWIYTGKIPKSITKKVTKGKTHKWLIDSKKGIKAIECIKLNIDFVDK